MLSLIKFVCKESKWRNERSGKAILQNNKRIDEKIDQHYDV